MSSDKERKKLLTDKQQAIVDIVVTTLGTGGSRLYRGVCIGMGGRQRPDGARP